MFVGKKIEVQLFGGTIVPVIGSPPYTPIPLHPPGDPSRGIRSLPTANYWYGEAFV